ncbi:MAG: hypothetical protein AAGH76_15065 [Pseudomonadota bacterium]
MPCTLRNARLIVEAVVCFGPAALVLLIGFFVLPTWIGSWASLDFDSNPFIILPAAAVVLGVIGMVGLVQVRMNILRDGLPLKGRQFRLICLGCGLCALFIINVLLFGVEFSLIPAD